jgi:hypothetical protein
MQIERKKYAWLIISQDGNLGIVPQDEINLELKDLQSAVGVGGGFIEIVAPKMFQFINPYLRMVVDDMGLYKEECKLNVLASALYCGDIVGDVVVCTTFNPDPYAEPDVYAMEFEDALKLRGRLLRLSRKLQAAVSERDVRDEVLQND